MSFALSPTARIFVTTGSPPPAFPFGDAAPQEPNGAGTYLGATVAIRDAAGSRRRRLWELPHNTLCPLMGVCLSIAQLRRALGKAEGGEWASDDYQVHCGAINEASRRGPVCDALQRELEQRHATTIKRFAAAKTTEALEASWSDEFKGSDIAGALWAGLTHPRCDTALRERICADIHMLQHQLGAGHRADLTRLEQLAEQNAALGREFAALQERGVRALADRKSQIDTLRAELDRHRAEGIRQNLVIAAQRQALAERLAGRATYDGREDAERKMHAQLERIRHLEAEVARWQEAARHERRRGDERGSFAASSSGPAMPVATPASAQVTPSSVTVRAPEDLRDKSVLCVGGRTASVPTYRRLIEVTGGRFSHHDGGEKQTQAQLEASLAAADMVICQTGCVSHDAYWRVKDHCKRTGKRCVFVDNPSASSLARSLQSLGSLQTGRSVGVPAGASMSDAAGARVEASLTASPSAPPTPLTAFTAARP